MNIEVDAQMTLEKAHAIAEEVRHHLFHNIHGVSDVIIHTDPHGHNVDHHALTAHHMQQSQRPVAPR